MKIAFCLLLLGVGAVLPLRAEPLVRWHGTYLTIDIPGVPLRLKEGSPIESGVFYPARQINPDHGGYDQTAPSAIFYGAIQLVNHSTSGKMDDAMNQVRSTAVSATPEKNVLLVSTAPGLVEHGYQNARGLIYWEKAEFLSHANKSVRLEDLSEFLLECPEIRSGKKVWFALRSRGQWYLSEEMTVEPGVSEICLKDPSAASWQKWDFPPESNTLEIPDGIPEIDGKTLDEIEAVGFYFDATYTSTSRAAFAIQKFQVQ